MITKDNTKKQRFQLLQQNIKTNKLILCLDDHAENMEELKEKSRVYQRSHELEPGFIWQWRVGGFFENE